MPQTQIDGGKQIEPGTVTLGAGGDVTGVLPVANGGTGLSASGANGNVLTSNGSAFVSTPLSLYSPVPQVLSSTYTVATNTQDMFFIDIDLQAAAGDLIVNGMLQGVR